MHYYLFISDLAVQREDNVQRSLNTAREQDNLLTNTIAHNTSANKRSRPLTTDFDKIPFHLLPSVESMDGFTKKQFSDAIEVLCADYI